MIDPLSPFTSEWVACCGFGCTCQLGEPELDDTQEFEAVTDDDNA